MAVGKSLRKIWTFVQRVVKESSESIFYLHLHENMLIHVQHFQKKIVKVEVVYIKCSKSHQNQDFNLHLHEKYTDSCPAPPMKDRQSPYSGVHEIAWMLKESSKSWYKRVFPCTSNKIRWFMFSTSKERWWKPYLEVEYMEVSWMDVCIEQYKRFLVYVRFTNRHLFQFININNLYLQLHLQRKKAVVIFWWLQW